MSGKIKTGLDPLFQLFEHYLFNRSYEDITAFTKDVAEEYIAYLDSTFAFLPYHSRTLLIKDLESETHEMLVKRMYGCMKPSDYVNSGMVVKLNGRSEIVALFDFSPPTASSEESAK